MLALILRQSVLHSKKFVCLIVGLSACGGLLAWHGNYEVLPPLSKPTSIISVEAPGMSVESLEQQIVGPLELVLQTLPNVEKITSNTVLEFAEVTIVFSTRTNGIPPNILLQEKLANSRLFINHATYKITDANFTINDYAQIGVENKSQPPSRFYQMVNQVINEVLVATKGSGQVSAAGFGKPQIQINISAEKLAASKLLLEVFDINLSMINKNFYLGLVEKNQKQQQFVLAGFPRTMEELRQQPVGKATTGDVLLGDVAEIREGFARGFGSAGVNGQEATVIGLQKKSYSSMSEAIADIKKAIQKRFGLDSKIAIYDKIFDQSLVLKESVSNLSRILIESSFIVIVLLFIVYIHPRPAVINMLTIPLSLGISMLLIKAMGLNVNTFTFAGLGVAIGELVDDSVVDVSNILKKMESKVVATHAEFQKLVYEASLEIRKPIWFSTLIILLGLLPCFMLESITARLFLEAALAYFIAILSSMIVSMTYTPAATTLFLNRIDFSKKYLANAKFIENLFERISRWALNSKYLVLSVSVGLFLIGGLIFGAMPSRLIAQFNENSYLVSIMAPVDEPLKLIQQHLLKLESELLKLDTVSYATHRSGRAQVGNHFHGLSATELTIGLKSFSSQNPKLRGEISNFIRQHLPEDYSIHVTTPTEHQLDHLLAGEKYPLMLKATGEGFKQLQSFMVQVDSALKVLNITDYIMDVPNTIENAKLSVLPSVRQSELLPINIFSSLSRLMNGMTLGQINDRGMLVDVFASFDQATRQNIESLGRLAVQNNSGSQPMTVASVSNLSNVEALYSIRHENGVRRAMVGFGGVVSATETIDQLQPHLARISSQFPDVRYWFDGQAIIQIKNYGRYLVGLILVLLLIGALLVFQFKSLSVAIQILVSVPLAAIGGLVSLQFFIGEITLFSLVGFVTLLGLSMRNTILLIYRFLEVAEANTQKNVDEVVLQGIRDRTRPILITALTTVLALLPVLFFRNSAGNEFLYPVAVVLLGGITFISVLNFAVTPVLFCLFHKGKV